MQIFQNIKVVNLENLKSLPEAALIFATVLDGLVCSYNEDSKKLVFYRISGKSSEKYQIQRAECPNFPETINKLIWDNVERTERAGALKYKGFLIILNKQ